MFDVRDDSELDNIILKIIRSSYKFQITSHITSSAMINHYFGPGRPAS